MIIRLMHPACHAAIFNVIKIRARDCSF